MRQKSLSHSVSTTGDLQTFMFALQSVWNFSTSKKAEDGGIYGYIHYLDINTQIDCRASILLITFEADWKILWRFGLQHHSVSCLFLLEASTFIFQCIFRVSQKKVDHGLELVLRLYSFEAPFCKWPFKRFRTTLSVIVIIEHLLRSII